MNWIKIYDSSRRVKENEIVFLLIHNCRCIVIFNSMGWQVDFWIDAETNNRFFNSYDDLQKYIQKNITHWMPLPEPPKD